MSCAQLTSEFAGDGAGVVIGTLLPPRRYQKTPESARPADTNRALRSPPEWKREPSDSREKRTRIMKRYIAAPLLAFIIGLPQVVHAQRITPPAVPDAIQVPSGYKPYLMAHAVGTQGYVCVQVGAAFSWAPFGPQATLFNADNEQIMTHFLNPTPYSLVPGPTWQHSRDSSVVWGNPIASSSDPNFVAADAIPWLLVEAAVVGDGPTGGVKLVPTRYIQRVSTFEGAAPSTGCATVADIKKRALVYYEADYVFYKERARNFPDEEN